jgi:anti-sigma-K factor RskA
MRCYSRWNNPEEKRKRSEKASRAAMARWDAYHAALADEPIPAGPPDDMYRLTFENLMTKEVQTLIFHPGNRLNNYDIDVNGGFWRRAGFAEAIKLIRKACYRRARKEW